MRVCDLVKKGERVESYSVIVPAELDEKGNIIVEERKETRTRIVPVMAVEYRDMTPEEIAEMERQKAEAQEPDPTPEERLTIMEDAFADLCKEVFGNG